MADTENLREHRTSIVYDRAAVLNNEFPLWSQNLFNCATIFETDVCGCVQSGFKVKCGTRE